MGFLNLGDQIHSQAVCLNFLIGTDSRITNLYVMKASMKAHAKEFGDVVINDGTQTVERSVLICRANTLTHGANLSSNVSHNITRAI